MKVVSIFTSLDGEVTYGGQLQWSTFVRLAGCNLRCYGEDGYCDAPHALDAEAPGVHECSVEYVAGQIKARGASRVTITGGEPLLQVDDVDRLCLALGPVGRYDITLETNGSLPLPQGYEGSFDSVVMDLKTPSTGMGDKVCWDNFPRLSSCDFVKVVAAGVEDLEWALHKLRADPLAHSDFITRAKVAVGPKVNHDGTYAIEPAAIVDWMREHGLWTWRLNLQLHKIIWPFAFPPVADLAAVNVGSYCAREV